MDFPLTLALGAALAIFPAASCKGKAAAPRVQDAPTWRTDLKAAMDEARLTKRPLLAVFR